MIWISCRVLQVETSCSRNSIKAALVCRSAVLPCTLPVFTSSAAYNDRVPFRRYGRREGGCTSADSSRQSNERTRGADDPPIRRKHGAVVNVASALAEPATTGIAPGWHPDGGRDERISSRALYRGVQLQIRQTGN